jgi:hypothetical protein
MLEREKGNQTDKQKIEIELLEVRVESWLCFQHSSTFYSISNFWALLPQGKQGTVFG